jgi:hypothetical protein
MSDLDKKIIRRTTEFDPGENTYYVTEHYRDGTHGVRRLASEEEALEYREVMYELDSRG